MDEIERRLRETSENCLTAYAEWSKARRDFKSREAMAEAVHELRKVSARLEIELAASEREELSQRPIPIPPHRSSQKKSQDEGNLPSFITRGNQAEEDFGDENDNYGNGGPSRQSHGGGGGGGGNNNPRRHGGGGGNQGGGGKTVTLERRFTGGRRGGSSTGGGGNEGGGNAQPAAAAAPAAAAPAKAPANEGGGEE